MKRAMMVATLLFLPAWVAFHQSSSKAPAFDVASIKPNTTNGSKLGKGTFLPSGRVEFPNGTLKLLIMSAFEVPAGMITGGPSWLDSDRFDVVAMSPPETDQKTQRAMLQTLLAERFKLAFHRNEKVVQQYALTVVKAGPKMARSSGSEEKSCKWENAEHGNRRRVCRNMTMAELAKALPGWGGIGVDRPVVDMTGLTDAYDFRFEIGPAKKRAVDTEENSGPTIFDALAQLGLKLEPHKGSVSTIVIDHVEKPSEN